MSLTRLRITPLWDRKDGFVFLLTTVSPDGSTVDLEHATKETLAKRVREIRQCFDIKNVDDRRPK